MTTTPYDVEVGGSWGLYSIAPLTRAACAWLRKHASSGERTWLHGALMCEGGDRCRELVAGMVAAGLAVTVNGVNMAGFRRES
jgi:hypothetical protein